MGASLQQIGLVYTTAGKAGFITGLYVVIVPMMGLFWRQKTDAGTWVGALLAAIGLYFLSVTETFTISVGDFLELAGAFFWAGHVLIIGWLSPRINPIRLSFWQFAVCSVLSLMTAFCIETVSLAGIFRRRSRSCMAGCVPWGRLYPSGRCTARCKAGACRYYPERRGGLCRFRRLAGFR